MPRRGVRIRQSRRLLIPLPRSPGDAGRNAGEPALGMAPPCPVRAHPLVSEVDQPGTGAQLPFYPLLQPVCHRGHPDPRLHQGSAAGRCPHCPVQPAGPLGLRPRAGARPLAQPGPEAFSGQTVFHKTRKISGKQTSPSRLRRATRSPFGTYVPPPPAGGDFPNRGGGAERRFKFASCDALRCGQASFDKNNRSAPQTGQNGRSYEPFIHPRRATRLCDGVDIQLRRA